MSVTYPLAIVDPASITSLVSMTLYHHSASACHTRTETNEGVTTLGGKADSAAVEDPGARLVSDLLGVQAVENQMAVEEAKSKG